MAQQKDVCIPTRCKKEKGRNLCLYSSTEHQRKSTNSAVDIEHINKKYFANMYMMSKWSKFVRELYQNNTLDKFCNKMDDGTYVLGVPASSNAIEHVVLAINFENDQIVNPHHGSVSWIKFHNVIDALNIANFLQIEDILQKCFNVIKTTFPTRIGDNKEKTRFWLSQDRYSSNPGDSSWYFRRLWKVTIQATKKLKESKEALYVASNLMVLISYFQHRSFDWSASTVPVKSFIESFLLGFLSIDAKLVSTNKKMNLFDTYVKKGDHAYDLFYRLAFMTFAQNAETTI
eukprot:330001_1